ncbi:MULTISPECIES: acyltransferase family protein [unclassified Thiocapsa]|uniref:acyltransferase family protein n=1 Tax=unclassified Thiocapsa TaxID=2641286 RepID=UPI0035B243E6
MKVRPSQHRGFTYRPDVDGLRAVAVIAVMLYHAGLTLTPGGFVGVDVFFVISGFVIASVVQADLARGRFTLRGFYERRIRRIFPALFAMIAVTLVIGWFVMMADDYKRLGQSAAANALFLSNFYFMKDSGYFGVTAAAKPLLHTWSLAVEEQFYLLLPLYLLLIKRWTLASLRWVTLGIGLASLALAIWVTPHEPYASFFMLPTRAWELLMGVLLAHGFMTAPPHRRAAQARALLGIGLILFAVVVYSEETTFPGLAALPPVMGTALLISAGAGGGWTTAWLASRPMVFVGQISYPLYLWHFPLLGFASYLSLTGLTLVDTLVVNLVIVVCAVLSWQVIERPVRERRVLKTQRSVFVFALFCMAATLVAGLVINLERGIESRFDGMQLRIVQGMTDRIGGARNPCMALSPAQIADGAFCVLGDTASRFAPDALVWGDSHAEALAPGIGEVAARAGRAVFFAGAQGCPIGSHLRDVSWLERDCAAFDRAMLDSLRRRPEISQVILVSRWVPLRVPEPAGEGSSAGVNGLGAADSLGEVVRALTAAGKRVWLVGPVPDVGTLVPRALYLQSLGFARDVETRPSEASFYDAQERTLAVLGELARQPGVSLVLPHERFCSDGWCEVIRDGYPLYFDDNHLTTVGAKSAAQVLEPVFR